MKRSSTSNSTRPMPRVLVLLLGALLGVFVVLISVIALQDEPMLGRNVENFGRAAPPAKGILYSEGQFLTPLQRHIARRIGADPRLVAALAYLREDGGFQAGIRLDANACWGLDPHAGTHYDTITHVLTLCLVPVDGFRGTLSRTQREGVDRTTDDATLFVLLHEIGHAFFTTRRVPVLGRDEDAADEFAVHVALHIHAAQIVDAGARYYESELHDGGPGDAHVDPARRAFRLRCLVFGSAPKHFAQWIGERKATSDCIDTYRDHHKSWIDVLRQASVQSTMHAI